MEIKGYKKDFSGLGLRMVLAAVAIYGVQIVSQYVVLAIHGEWIRNMNIMLAATMIPMYAVGFPVAFWIMRRGVAEQTIEKHSMSPLQILMAFFMSYAILMAGNIIGLLVTMGIGIVKGEPVINNLAEVVGSGNIWISAIYMVLLAPVFEEYLFRRLICNRVLPYGQGMAIAISGLLFGLFHGNFNQFFYAFFLGCFFAFIYVKTGRLRYTIILHMMVNFMGSVVGGLLLQNVDLEQISASGMIISALYLLFVFGIVIAGAVLLLANLSKLKADTGEITIVKGKRFETAIVNVGMVLYCVIFLVMMVIQAFV